MVVDTIVTDDYGVLQAINSYRTARYKELKRTGLSEPGVFEQNLLSLWANRTEFRPFNTHPAVLDAFYHPAIQAALSTVAQHILNTLQSHYVEVQLKAHHPGMLSFKVNHHDPQNHSTFA